MNEHKLFLENADKLILEDKTFQLSELIYAYPNPRQLALAEDDNGQNILFKITAIKDQKLALKTCDYMIKYHANVKKKDKLLQTAFYYAARYQNLQLVQYFYKLGGVNLKQVDVYYQTPLFYCGRYNQKTNVSQFIINNQCDVNHKDHIGQTCLFYAAGYGKLQICKLLIRYGANPNIADINKKKAINYARNNGHSQIINFLNSYKSGGKMEQINSSKLQYEYKQKQKKPQKQLKLQKNPGNVSYQESSQNIQKKKKGNVIKNECVLVYTDENGNSRAVNEEQLQQFRKQSQNNEKIYQLMYFPDEIMEYNGATIDRRFEKGAVKLLTHFQKDINGFYFNQPVNPILLNIPDYPSIIKHPMDFGTIKKKLNMSVYISKQQFRQDMNLVFDNCIMYNGTERQIGKIALQMKAEFNTMFNRQLF